MTSRLLSAQRPATWPAFVIEVIEGLSAEQKTLPPKLFYDERGSALFEAICRQPEYYLTRTELEILTRWAGEIAALAGPNAMLVEYGSGTGRKVRALLNAMVSPAGYVPVDLSRKQLEEAASDLRRHYPNLPVRPRCADYNHSFEVPAIGHGRRVACFLGSSIGNFHPAEAIAFLTRVRHTVGQRGALVLGVDRRKNPAVLHAAYNDAAGVTADFNRNILRRLNRELDATFDEERFAHRTFYSPEAGRVEMHLVAQESHDVVVADRRIRFQAGETIWTESSYKYRRQDLEAIARAARFAVIRLWSDPRKRFWVAVLEPC